MKKAKETATIHPHQKNPSRQQQPILHHHHPMKNDLFDDDDGYIPPNNNAPFELEVDKEYLSKLESNREREDAKRYARAVAEGKIVEGESESSESEASDPEEEIGEDEVSVWLESLIKLRNRDPEYLEKGKEAVTKKDPKKKDKKDKKKKKMYLKDVQAQQLLEQGPALAEDDEGTSERIQTYNEHQEELRRAVNDAVEAGGEGSDDDDDLLKAKEDDSESEEEDEEIKEIADEYFGKETELNENDKYLRDYMLKQMWKEKDGKREPVVIEEAEMKEISDDELLVIKQEEHETKYRHEDPNAGPIVWSHSRFVEGSVRKKDSARKNQRDNREERRKIAEIEREEELKRLKNVKKKEISEKMKKVLSIAGFKEGDEFPLDARGLDDEFDPVEYDKMMKAAFDDDYYGAEDSEMREDDDDDDEKPDFDKEDELLGLPKNWDVIQGGDGFTATREKVLKQKENGDSDDDEEQEEEAEGEVDEEEEREGKRKRKRKASLVKRAKEALMEEYYKLDYEDTIGDLKTRFKFAKVQPNSYGLEKEEILFLDDTELNQYVPLKKMAPYMEKDWEVNKYKLKEQKHKFSELLERIDDPNEKKRSKKKSKKRDAEEKRDVVKEKKKRPAEPVAEEEGEAETSKLSRKAKRRRREAEKKLPPNRMVAYGKTN